MYDEVDSAATLNGGGGGVEGEGGGRGGTETAGGRLLSGIVTA